MNDIMGQSGGKPPRAGFRLDKTSGKLFGVCAGIGNYFDIDPLLVRIGFVLGTLFGFGSFILIYLAIALIAD
ncbi:recombinase RecF [Porphyrobacter sp. HT-58-2]|uniref:PspC domain-containing protein n=1 Tax=Porphyrobacter sp. HT-58-2 TaxID=2023229 RepID=UPI000CDC2BE1|nr:PspC domain-containing protein [Porphyrobacter sp. HT-58-2]AUX70388.1 recombinase RecF [Porphyrobacter sp. HT-58-2]